MAKTQAQTVLDEWTFSVMAEQAAVTEKRLRVLLRLKPKWLPLFAWRRLIARLLVIEETLSG